VIVVVVDNLTCVETRKRPKPPSQFLRTIEAARSVEEAELTQGVPTKELNEGIDRYFGIN
jgi:hypothetical protein